MDVVVTTATHIIAVKAEPIEEQEGEGTFCFQIHKWRLAGKGSWQMHSRDWFNGDKINSSAAIPYGANNFFHILPPLSLVHLALTAALLASCVNNN
jgi:hypothetical protein